MLTQRCNGPSWRRVCRHWPGHLAPAWIRLHRVQDPTLFHLGRSSPRGPAEEVRWRTTSCPESLADDRASADAA